MSRPVTEEAPTRLQPLQLGQLELDQRPQAEQLERGQQVLPCGVGTLRERAAVGRQRGAGEPDRIEAQCRDALEVRRQPRRVARAELDRPVKRPGLAAEADGQAEEPQSGQWPQEKSRPKAITKTRIVKTAIGATKRMKKSQTP